jgi:hypothetical protein
MNRVLSIFLAFTVMLASLADVRDLAKIALLINHYHQAHEQISLSEFLELHYGASAAQHDKEHGHKSLPFKSHERTLIQPLTAALSFTFITSAPAGETSQAMDLYRSVFITEFSASIWQPPRLG